MTTFKDLKEVDNLVGPLDISMESWRRYSWPGAPSPASYTIQDPVGLYYHEGGTTHRVVDIRGVVHCVPCGRLHPHTVITWETKFGQPPVRW
jgi:hypothetical protein